MREASLADGVDVLQKLHRIKRGWVGPPGFGPCSSRIARSELRERVGDFLVRAGPEQIDLARMIAQEEATVRGHNELLRRVSPRELRGLRDGRRGLHTIRVSPRLVFSSVGSPSVTTATGRRSPRSPSKVTYGAKFVPATEQTDMPSSSKSTPSALASVGSKNRSASPSTRRTPFAKRTSPRVTSRYRYKIRDDGRS